MTMKTWGCYFWPFAIWAVTMLAILALWHFTAHARLGAGP